MACLVTTSRNERNGNGEERRLVGRGRHETADVFRERDRCGGDGAGEPGDKRRPPCQERGERPERIAQIDVLAAGARPKRRQLRIGHRAGERQHAAEHPDAEHGPCRRHHARATSIGTKKMPLPMTLDTTMAAPSKGPSRRRSVGSSTRSRGLAAGVLTGGCRPQVRQRVPAAAPVDRWEARRASWSFRFVLQTPSRPYP